MGTVVPNHFKNLSIFIFDEFKTWVHSYPITKKKFMMFLYDYIYFVFSERVPASGASDRFVAGQGGGQPSRNAGKPPCGQQYRVGHPLGGGDFATAPGYLVSNSSFLPLTNLSSIHLIRMHIFKISLPLCINLPTLDVNIYFMLIASCFKNNSLFTSYKLWMKIMSLIFAVFSFILDLSFYKVIRFGVLETILLVYCL